MIKPMIIIIYFMELIFPLEGCTDPEAYNCEESMNGEYVTDIGGIIYNYTCDGTTQAGTESCNNGEICEGFYNPDADTDNGSCRYYQAPHGNEVVLEVIDANHISLDWSAFAPPDLAVLSSFHIQRCTELGCTWLTGFTPGNSSLETSAIDDSQWQDGMEIKYAIAAKYENNPYWGWAIGASYITPSMMAIVEESAPFSYILQPVYPNPFNPILHIKFDVLLAGSIQLDICDITGAHIETLHLGFLHTGSHEMSWNAESMPSGLYLVSLKSGLKISTEKVMLLK